MNSYGTPGGSLVRAGGWTTGDRAAQGQLGERACAELLGQAFADDPDVYVLHDLRIPGYQANVDHVVVRGFQILLIDAKQWKPGLYWTMGGTTRRGRETVPHADKQTLAAAARKLRERLVAVGDSIPSVKPHVAGLRIDAVTIVFASDDGGKVNTTLYRPKDGTAIAGGPKAASRLAKRLKTGGLPAPCGPILRSLHGLLPDQTTVAAHGR